MVKTEDKPALRRYELLGYTGITFRVILTSSPFVREAGFLQQVPQALGNAPVYLGTKQKDLQM